jgi:hypothetical protein
MMPKRKNVLTPEEQSERFKREVQRLIDAGELNPTEADLAFEKLADKVLPMAVPKR